MAEINNYKCSNCGGMLQFSSQKQMMVCTSCGSEFPVAMFDQAAAMSGEQQYQAKTDNWDVQGEGVLTVIILS